MQQQLYLGLIDEQMKYILGSQTLLEQNWYPSDYINNDNLEKKVQ